MTSDEALIERWRRGELAAFDVLYERYEASLFHFIRRQLGDAAEAEDVLHETFIAVLKSRELTRSFRAWLFQTARHACLNRARTSRRAASAHERADEPAPQNDASLVLELQQRTAALERAVAALPSTLGEIYALRAKGLSYEEAADVLEIPVGTAKSRMHEVLTRLRLELKTP